MGGEVATADPDGSDCDERGVLHRRAVSSKTGVLPTKPCRTDEREGPCLSQILTNYIGFGEQLLSDKKVMD